jgi:hypothetical protein
MKKILIITSDIAREAYIVGHNMRDLQQVRIAHDRATGGTYEEHTAQEVADAFIKNVREAQANLSEEHKTAFIAKITGVKLVEVNTMSAATRIADATDLLRDRLPDGWEFTFAYKHEMYPYPHVVTVTGPTGESDRESNTDSFYEAAKIIIERLAHKQ